MKLDDKTLGLVIVIFIALVLLMKKTEGATESCTLIEGDLDRYMSKLFGGPGVVVNGEFVSNKIDTNLGKVPSIPGDLRIGGHIYMTEEKDLSKNTVDSDRHIFMGGTPSSNAQYLKSAYGWNGMYSCNKKWSGGSRGGGDCFQISD